METFSSDILLQKALKARQVSVGDGVLATAILLSQLMKYFSPSHKLDYRRTKCFVMYDFSINSVMRVFRENIVRISHHFLSTKIWTVIKDRELFLKQLFDSILIPSTNFAIAVNLRNKLVLAFFRYVSI